MFSGIIEEFATVVAIKKDRDNIDFTLTCSFVDELSIDQSVAHNGVCLTVVTIHQPSDNCPQPSYTVTAMKETLDRTNLGLLKVGDKVNIERSMLMNGRLDGHIVQGHVDETARCIAMDDANGSTYFTFEYKEDREMARKGYFTVDKGSVTVNGVSLKSGVRHSRQVYRPSATAVITAVATVPRYEPSGWGYVSAADISADIPHSRHNFLPTFPCWATPCAVRRQTVSSS